MDAQRSVRVRGELVQLETVPVVPFSCPASIHQNPLVSHSVWGSHTRHRHQQDVSTTHKPAHLSLHPPLPHTLPPLAPSP